MQQMFSSCTCFRYCLQFIERHLENEQRVHGELQRLQQQQQQLQQQLQQLNPNFKVDQKLTEIEAQVQQQEKEQQEQRLEAAKAEADLKALRSSRKEAFMKCFLHCQRVLSLIFAHLSAGVPVQDEHQHQEPSNLYMLEDMPDDPWQQRQQRHQQQFDSMGGQAFLDLESSTTLTREEEPFNWYVFFARRSASICSIEPVIIRGRGVTRVLSMLVQRSLSGLQVPHETVHGVWAA